GFLTAVFRTGLSVGAGVSSGANSVVTTGRVGAAFALTGALAFAEAVLATTFLAGATTGALTVVAADLKPASAATWSAVFGGVMPAAALISSTTLSALGSVGLMMPL